MNCCVLYSSTGITQAALKGRIVCKAIHPPIHPMPQVPRARSSEMGPISKAKDAAQQQPVVSFTLTTPHFSLL